MAQEDVFKKLVSHCKEYGFVFPSSDIYDGLGAVFQDFDACLYSYLLCLRCTTEHTEQAKENVFLHDL